MNLYTPENLKTQHKTHSFAFYFFIFFYNIYFLITPIHSTSFYQLKKKKNRATELYRFGSAIVSVWSCSSDGSTAPVSERDSPSDRRPWLSRSVLEVVRQDRRRSVGSALVLVCSPLLSPTHFEFSLFNQVDMVAWVRKICLSCESNFLIGEKVQESEDYVKLFCRFELFVWCESEGK